MNPVERSAVALLIFLAGACSGSTGQTVLTADTLLHLDDHLDEATIEGSELPDPIPAAVEWRFDQPQPEWKPVPLPYPPFGSPTLTRTSDALRVTLTDRVRVSRPPGALRGVIGVEVPNWHRADWAEVVIRARADGESPVNRFGLGFNLWDGQTTASAPPTPIQFFGQMGRVVRSGTIETYRLQVRLGAAGFRGPWQQLLIFFGSDKAPGSIDLLSVSVIPHPASVAPHSVGKLDVEGILRPGVFIHAPSRVSWRLRVPDGGRLAVALATRTYQPVTFSVTVSDGSDETSVFREVVEDESRWHERLVDLSAFAGRSIDLSLRTESDRPGQIAFWGSPIVSRDRRAAARGNRRPNVILYVIDGAGADLMSLYGYNRRTTPNLDRLALDGVVFERAHSNSGWTKPSTASFMTSLQHSALGGFRDWGDRIPEGAPIMAERFHEAGYQTAVFTFHPNAGRSSGLDRGVDRFQDQDRPGQTHHESSRFLQAEFWDWRTAFPGAPYWAHFQVTDVHEPTIPVPPFAGLFVDPERRQAFDGWIRRFRIPDLEEGNRTTSVAAQYRAELARLGIDAVDFYDTQRGLYDETMTHADYHLGRLVDRLEATSEWEDTILIVTSDHGHPAGSHTRFGRELFDPPPPDTEGALLDSYRTRVPLVIVAPGRLPAGRWVREAVSLVDLLPTVLDLAGLPPLARSQGRSLVPLMRGDANWESRPVILEQLERDVRTGEFTGHIEMIDGRWGASLEIWPRRAAGDPPVELPRWAARARLHADDQPRLLLYDLWADPFARRNVNAHYPELVEQYTERLEREWSAHLALAARLKPGRPVTLTPEQLERLRALGYIR